MQDKFVGFSRRCKHPGKLLAIGDIIAEEITYRPPNRAGCEIIPPR
jgi:hypothetical protein